MRPERQFQQVGAEIIGSESYNADVEIINLAYETLKSIGVKNIVIEIAAPFFIESLLKKVKNKKIRSNLIKSIKQKDIKSCLSLLKNEEIIKNFNVLNSLSGSIKKKKLQIAKLTKIIGFENEVKRLIKIGNLIKISKNDALNVDFMESFRSKNYYQGIKFTFFAKNIRGEIAGGGRYQLKYGTNSETAIGYTCYMDSILRASSFKNKNKTILIPFNTDNKIKKMLINKGYSLFKSFEYNNDLKSETKKFGIKYFLSKKIIKKV